MHVSKEFSKNASSYGEHNIIQKQVVSNLLKSLHVQSLDSVLDLGCGDGAVYNTIGKEVEHFYAVDFAEGMLEAHPKADNIISTLADFNDETLFLELQEKKIDRLISSSSLQWAQDLDKTFRYIKTLDTKVSLALFTCNTFKTMYEVASLPKLLRCADEITELSKRYFDASYELLTYKLHFNSNQEMFRYIKKSGVSGARKVLNYKETKALIQNYPYDYLEFEVLFIIES